MKLATAFVEVRPDTKGFRADLQRDTESDVRSVGKVLSQAFAGGAFLAGAKRAIDAASDLNEAANVTKITFGAAEQQVADFAKTAATSIGQSEAAARQATATFGGLLLNLGFTEKAAADTSISLTKLASDLGSAFNTDPAEAALALSSALRGEQEPILRYNVLLSDTAVRQKAVELGLAATTAAVDDNGKVQARLALIMEQTSRVQGDFANTSEGAANAQRIAAAQAEDAAADLGDNLIPIYEKIVAVVGDVATVFGALPEPVQTAVVALAGIVALSGPTRLAVEAIGSLASIVRVGLSKALDGAAIGAYNFAGNLGKIAVGAGALGGALFAASKILGDYQESKADAARIEQSYTDILADQTEEVEKNTRAFAGSELLKGELGQALRQAGADVDVFTTAIADGTAALGDDLDLSGLIRGTIDLDDALNDVDPGPLRDELIRLNEAGELTDRQLQQLIVRLIEQERGYRNGAREAANKAAADEAAGVAAGGAVGPTGEFAGKLDDTEAAAKEAAEQVDAFREAVDKVLRPLNLQAAQDARTQGFIDLGEEIEARAKAVDDARQRLEEVRATPVADRDPGELAEAERDLADAIADTSLALDGDTEAAIRNRDTLKELFETGIDVIETAVEQGKSIEELELIRINERESLRETLRQYGFNEQKIDELVAAFDRIPVTPKELQVTADTEQAQLRIKELADSLLALGPGGQFSIDAAVIDRNLQRASAQARAAGGDVMDGLFLVGEAGPELLSKSGANVSVISGGPAALDDGIGRDLLMEQRIANDLTRRLLAALDSGGAGAMRDARRSSAVIG